MVHSVLIEGGDQDTQNEGIDKGYESDFIGEGRGHLDGCLGKHLNVVHLVHDVRDCLKQVHDLLLGT